MRDGKALGAKHRVSEERNKERRIVKVMAVTALISAILICAFALNYFLNSPSSDQTIESPSRKAAIVDHLSLTFPNQTFTEAATNKLKQANYTVDYYPGEKVTVDFWRELPTHNYGLIILRVHSAAAEAQGQEFVEAPLALFTCEEYSTDKHVSEQLADQLVIASYSMPNPPYYFAITPEFVTSRMNGNFNNAVIIMMGCEGLNNTKMASAFMRKGAKAYIGWNLGVSAYHTDQAVITILEHAVVRNETIRQTIAKTLEEVGPDPASQSVLLYYPPDAGDQTIESLNHKNQAQSLVN